MNHLFPPFNDVRARRAVLMAMSQEDYMRALVGDDNNLWKPLPGYFTPGTPLYTEEGGDILKGPRNLDAAKKLLAASGYAGEPVTCLVAQDQPITKAQGWQMFHTWHAGADCVSPAPYNAIRANADKAWFGWPNSPEVETEITSWFEAKNFDEERAAINRVNKSALDFVVYAPTGFFLSYQAWRKNVSGITKGPLPFFWGVGKSA
jgi:peptide/nickel transport system substrate-binding protein